MSTPTISIPTLSMNKKKPKRPTMTDVADVAGVSLKTVSRVVNDEGGVSDDLVDRVKTAIKQLGYRPNELARSLRGGTSSTVGLVITDISTPFYSRLARTIEAEIDGRLMVVASSGEDQGREMQLVRRFIERNVDGLIIVPASQDESYLEELDLGKTPVVFVDRPPAQPTHDVVVLDSRWAAAEAVRTLAGYGCERIAMVGLDSSMYFTEVRVAGYRDGIASMGAEVDESLVLVGSRTSEEAREALRTRLQESDPPDGVLAGNYTMALGVVRALLDEGCHIPVAGFDNFELSDILPMPFITVTNDPIAMGKAAASMLLERIKGMEEPPRRMVITPQISTA